MADGKSKSSKKPRRAMHSGRARGSEIKTGKRGARRFKLDEGQKVLLGKGMIASTKARKNR